MKTIWKIIFTSVLHSKSKFLSIIIITMLGITCFTSVHSVINNSNSNLNTFLHESNAANIGVSSTIGMYDYDADVIKSIDGIKDACLDYSCDNVVWINDSKSIFKFQSVKDFNDQESINKLELECGRFPENNNECVLLSESDISIKSEIGNKISVCQNSGTKLDYLKVKEFTVVGFCHCVNYINKLVLGESVNGKDSINDIAFVDDSAFDQSLPHTNLYANFDEFNYSDKQSYNDLTNEIRSRVEDKLNDIKDYHASEMSSYLNLLKPADLKYYVSDLNENSGINTYKQTCDRTYNLIVPFSIIFLVTSLIIVVSIFLRLINDDRKQTGILKINGYGKIKIVSIYIFYAVMATICGWILGSYVITWPIMESIMKTINVTYYMKTYEMSLDLFACIRVGIIFLLAISLTSILCVVRTVNENISSLLRYRPLGTIRAKISRTVIRAFSFFPKFVKAAFRNIIRQPIKLVLLVAGITGCFVLVITGFNLVTAPNNMIKLQYEKIINESYEVSLSENISKTDIDNLQNKIENNIEGSYTLPVNNCGGYIELQKANDNEKDFIFLDVITTDDFSSLLNFRLLNNIEENNDENGVYISTKIAQSLDKKKGDYLNFCMANINLNKDNNVKILGVVENYSWNYIYMSSKTYNELFNVEYLPNLIMVNDFNPNGADANIYQLIEGMDCVDVINDESYIKNTYLEMCKSTYLLGFVLTVLSFFLLLIVLYGVTIISINEHKKDVALMNLLGCKHFTISQYVHAETFIEICFGVIFGGAVGYFFDDYILRVVEGVNMNIHESYLWWIYPVGLIVFNIVIFVILLLLRKIIKKLDIVTELKDAD